MSLMDGLIFRLRIYGPLLSLFQVVSPINKMIDTVPFNVLTYSLDWHPSDHLSFADNVTLRKLHESSPVGVPKKDKEVQGDHDH